MHAYMVCFVIAQQCIKNFSSEAVERVCACSEYDGILNSRTLECYSWICIREQHEARDDDALVVFNCRLNRLQSVSK